MELLLILVVVFAALALLLVLSRRQPPVDRGGDVVYERRHLFSKAERSFLGVLDQASDDQVRVFAKVRLNDLIGVPSGAPGTERPGARNRIGQKHVDFVLCDPGDLRVLAVVELDDASHGAARAKERDAFVDGALASAGIPVIRFAARASYAVDEVRRDLAPVMATVPPAAPSRRAKQGKAKHGKATGKGSRSREPLVSDAPARASVEAAPVAPAPASGRPSASIDRPPTSATGSATIEAAAKAPAEAPAVAPAAAPAEALGEAPAQASAEAPTPVRLPQSIPRDARPVPASDPYARLGSCPTCGKPLVERVGKRGALKGKTYLACSGDPPCAAVGAEA